MIKQIYCEADLLGGIMGRCILIDIHPNEEPLYRCTVGPHPPAVRVWHDESPRRGTPSRGAIRDCRCNPLSSTTLVTFWHIRPGNKRHVMTSWGRPQLIWRDTNTCH